jgi:hypothetical protein
MESARPAKVSQAKRQMIKRKIHERKKVRDEERKRIEVL